MNHWASRYVGIPYQPGVFDCAALLERVQAEVFGRQVVVNARTYQDMQGKYAQLRDMQAQIERERARWRRVEQPEEGDAVLIALGKRPAHHVGVFCLVNDAPHVLHAASNAGAVVLQRLRDLAVRNLNVEGFYRWT